jgi:hypothetical protein
MPDRPGKYLLRLTLVQEYIAWCHDLDPSNALDGLVEVSPVTPHPVIG